MNTNTTLTLTIKDAWKSIPKVFRKEVRIVTAAGVITGLYAAVPGVGVDFVGDRKYNPTEVVTEISFKSISSPLPLW